MEKNAPISGWFIATLGMFAASAALAVDLNLPAIPLMVSALSTEMSAGQQIVGLYIAGIAIGQLPAGLISDRVGRLPVLYAGMGLFTIAGIATYFATNIDVLLAARLLQGTGASAGIVLSRAMVRDVSSGKDAARLMSVMVMIFTVVPMLAPMLGSLIVAAFGWRASFGVVAIFGVINILAIGTALYETHQPGAKKQLLIQLRDSLREFVSHRQSLFGTSLVVLSAVGYMSMISGSAALILSIYGYPVEYFGIIFALQGAGLLLGSSLNRRLLIRYSSIQMLGVGAALTLVASLNALAIVWLGEADFWWAWGSSCVFMLGSAFIMTNGTSLALDPVPRSAGVGSSIVGTIQGLCSAMSALIAGAIYDGTVARSVVILGIAGVAIAALYFSRRLLLGGQPLYGQEG